ncbi:N6-adenine-specific DNA methyltransferase, N12 class [Sterolibacterium denitrificans]|uniref:site-specific DNA-methyltransferase (adenine-specific) n=2 Tax=Sterolibacterium denitrificans TaxID=157592 RepID=A0A7Z7HNI3_9PROT|nr:N6-adenine-specific DNA methyltransferase, N12 class [Sterolibacterium denitrificans]
MLALRRQAGRVLEPACGDGAFSNELPDCVAIELDRRHAPPGSLNIDFFAYPETEKFSTIIGNPPYVRHQDILPESKALIASQLFDQRSNLYLFFIEKAVRHLMPGGELIFITPRDFLKTTSSVRLNRWLHEHGTITHAIELGDARIFTAAVPNCLIWRFEKDCRDRSVQYAEIGNRDALATALAAPRWERRHFVENAGHLIFAKALHSLQLKDIARVKVGAVSGADDIYADEKLGNRDFVCAATARTGKTRRMIWVDKNARPPKALLPHKARLISRGIRPYDESNWWQWGRGYPITDAPRVYVNGRTRQSQPFFLHACKNFDGAVLAIFPHDPGIDLAAFCAALNAVAWDQLGFVCDGRYLFTQRSLENAPLPASLERFIPGHTPP